MGLHIGILVDTQLVPVIMPSTSVLLVGIKRKVSNNLSSTIMRNFKANEISMASITELDALTTGIARLQLNPYDLLQDLRLSSEDQFCLLAGYNAAGDPLSYSAAVKSPNKFGWLSAMREECQSLLDNSTFDLSEQCPVPSSALTCKWVFLTKRNSDGSMRFKARLVVRGFLQKEGIDFDETYAPVATHTTFRMLVALAAIKGWPIRQLDVVTAFLNPAIDNENIWVVLPTGSRDIIDQIDPRALAPLRETMREDKVILRLKKALYGLKQSPRLWWRRIDAVLTEIGLERANADTNLYFFRGKLLLLLYVDDIVIVNMESPITETLDNVIARLTDAFKMKDLGQLRKFLGFEVSDTTMTSAVLNQAAYVTISQRAYLNMLSKRYNVSQAKETRTPADTNVKIDNGVCFDNLLNNTDKVRYQSIVGALLYASLGTQPDIAYAVSALSQHCSTPRTTHMTAARRVLKYLKTTSNLALKYNCGGEVLLQGACDADWASSTIDRRSIGGYTFTLGNCLISWKAKRQTIIALLSLEAELMACSEASREAIWLRKLLGEILEMGKFNMEERKAAGHPLKLFCDNQGALSTILKGTANLSGRTKHIDIRHFYARKVQESGFISFSYIKSEENVADIITKSLNSARHSYLVDKLGMVDTGIA